MRARAWGPLCASLLLLAVPALAAFTVPKQTDYVTDTAGVLSADELKDLNNRIGDYERQSTNQIFVLVTRSLEGDPIEDVGYKLIQTWHPGQKGKDNGVVLIVALDDRRIRIETGKGVGGDLPDLQTSYIIRQRIVPLMREDRIHDAILAGVNGITEALSAAATSPRTRNNRQPDWDAAPIALPRWFDLCFWGFIGFVVLMLLLRASRHPRRKTYWGGPFIGGGWGGGGGGGGGGFGGGGGDGGSGFSGGGGGEGGGGGSSDSF